MRSLSIFIVFDDGAGLQWVGHPRNRLDHTERSAVLQPPVGQARRGVGGWTRRTLHEKGTLFPAPPLKTFRESNNPDDKRLIPQSPEP